MTNWDDLRFFLAVAREGSLSSAARVLEVSQPTVGRRIAAFEAALGAELFVATPTGQRLSATGLSMLAHAERMSAEATSATRVAYGRDVGVRGEVRITASEWMVASVLSTAVAPLAARHPGVTIELAADTRHLSLAKREADIALRPSKFKELDVVQRDVGAIAFGLYASDAYLARNGPPDFETGCRGHTLVAMSESLDKVPDRSWLPAIAGEARVAVRTNGREPMVALATAGVGLTCLPRFLGDRAPGLRRLTPPIAEPVRALWLGMHRDARKTPRVRTVFASLEDALRKLRTTLCPA